MQRRPKVLYAIQGTGNGHVARARALYPQLVQHFDVDLALVGKNSEVELPCDPVWKGRGITMYYSQKGGVNILKTIRKNSISQIRKEIQSIPVKDYDFVLNDFESVSIRAAKKYKVPVIGLSHQSAVQNPDSPKARKYMPFGKFILHRYAPCSESIGFHFERYNSEMFLPILRDEILESTWKSGERIIVYLPAYSPEILSEVLKSLPHEFTIFHKEALSSLKDDNILWEPINANKFSKELLQCKGVICSSGFELPSECLHLGIPLVVIPIKGQYEQGCNAASLEMMGVPVIYNLTKSKLQDSLEIAFRGRSFKHNIPDVRGKVIDAIKRWWERMRN